MSIEYLIRKGAILTFQITFFTVIITVLSVQIGKALPIPSHGAWGIFHYYLNAKYFEELGYFGLYSCALETKAPNTQNVKLARNLYNYDIVSHLKLPTCNTGKFANNRFEEFTKDVTHITNRADFPYWSEAFLDKGFNPTPFWAMLANIASSVTLTENTFSYLLIFNLDIILILSVCIFIFIKVGKTTGLIVLFLTITFFGNYGLIINNFLQYLWFPLLAMSMFQWKQNKYSTSGVFLALATSFQAFPIVFAIPVVIMLIFSRIKNDEKIYKSAQLFLIPFIVTVITCVIVSTSYTNNLTVWNQWYNKITVHKHYINNELFNIGFSNLFSTILTSPKINHTSYLEDVDSVTKRAEELSKNKFILHFLTAFAIMGILITLWKKKPTNPFLYGYLFSYLLLTLSPYYYLSLALIPLALWRHKRKTQTNITILLFILYGVHFVILRNNLYANFVYNIHFWSEIFIFLFFVSMLVLVTVEDEQ